MVSIFFYFHPDPSGNNNPKIFLRWVETQPPPTVIVGFLHGRFQKSEFLPQIIHFNKVFHYFHHPFWGEKTPPMFEILHQLRLLVYPIIYRVSSPSQVVGNGISASNNTSWVVGWLGCLPGRGTSPGGRASHVFFFSPLNFFSKRPPLWFYRGGTFCEVNINHFKKGLTRW